MDSKKKAIILWPNQLPEEIEYVNDENGDDSDLFSVLGNSYIQFEMYNEKSQNKDLQDKVDKLSLCVTIKHRWDNEKFNESATNIMKQFHMTDDGLFYWKYPNVYGPCVLISDDNDYGITLNDYNDLMLCIGHRNIKKSKYSSEMF